MQSVHMYFTECPWPVCTFRTRFPTGDQNKKASPKFSFWWGSLPFQTLSAPFIWKLKKSKQNEDMPLSQAPKHSLSIEALACTRHHMLFGCTLYTPVVCFHEHKVAPWTHWIYIWSCFILQKDISHGGVWESESRMVWHRKLKIVFTLGSISPNERVSEFIFSKPIN